MADRRRKHPGPPGDYEPAKLVEAISRLAPKDVAVTLEQRGSIGIDPEIWTGFKRAPAAIEECAPADTKPMEVFEAMEIWVRSEFAKADCWLSVHCVCTYSDKFQNICILLGFCVARDYILHALEYQVHLWNGSIDFAKRRRDPEVEH